MGLLFLSLYPVLALPLSGLGANFKKHILSIKFPVSKQKLPLNILK